VPKEKLDQLAKELAANDFDLAIDLRKQSDTRQLLKLAGARVTAGFDHRNEHSWLDIALTFEGDAALTNKRQHVSGDLLNLVDAVAAAGSKERTVIRRARDWSLRQMPVVNKLAASGLYERRVVCIHPAAGNETKQWPISYFADLIKMLRAIEDVNFAIIGAQGETAITARRNVSCSPCYRAKIELCHRNLACLRGLQPAAIADMCRSLIKLERGIRLA
jgi:ADP-heptose:LPS heptosyltransferase